MLPYFLKCEHHHTQGSSEHVYNGPIITTNHKVPGRNFPLREAVKEAWKSVGLQYNPDLNGGSPQGFADIVETRLDGKRQLVSEAYSLAGVKVLTNTLVKRVIVEEINGKMVATGVELADGKIFRAGKEVVISAGTYRTPQILLLSDIEPAEELQKHGIRQTVNLPNVGKNLHDHLRVSQW
jgi:choline dehydrogenase-like flavoprotein